MFFPAYSSFSYLFMFMFLFMFVFLTLFRCTNLEQMKKIGNDWKTEITKDQNKFRNFYFFVFDYLRQDKKVLAIEEVVAAWEMLGIRNK
jgi:hypothetical protein